MRLNPLDAGRRPSTGTTTRTCACGPSCWRRWRRRASGGSPPTERSALELAVAEVSAPASARSMAQRHRSYPAGGGRRAAAPRDALRRVSGYRRRRPGRRRPERGARAPPAGGRRPARHVRRRDHARDAARRPAGGARPLGGVPLGRVGGPHDLRHRLAAGSASAGTTSPRAERRHRRRAGPGSDVVVVSTRPGPSSPTWPWRGGCRRRGSCHGPGASPTWRWCTGCQTSTRPGASGSEQVGLARGLLADSETRVVYAQPPGEVEPAAPLLGLSSTEAELGATSPTGRGPVEGRDPFVSGPAPAVAAREGVGRHRCIDGWPAVNGFVEVAVAGLFVAGWRLFGVAVGHPRARGNGPVPPPTPRPGALRPSVTGRLFSAPSGGAMSSIPGRWAGLLGERRAGGIEPARWAGRRDRGLTVDGPASAG